MKIKKMGCYILHKRAKMLSKTYALAALMRPVWGITMAVFLGRKSHLTNYRAPWPNDLLPKLHAKLSSC